jgi:hypothetical protein
MAKLKKNQRIKKLFRIIINKKRGHLFELVVVNLD